jgi:sRNA-binding protein
MKTTLSLKKPLSFEKQIEINQMIGIKDEKKKKKAAEKPKPLESSYEKKKRVLDSVNWLQETYPKCFDLKNPKPLKKGIMNDLFQQALWTKSKTSLRDAISFYVESPLYHQAILEGNFRFDLNGENIEEINESEKEYSKIKLEKIKNKKLKKHYSSPQEIE